MGPPIPSPLQSNGIEKMVPFPSLLSLPPPPIPTLCSLPPNKLFVIFSIAQLIPKMQAMEGVFCNWERKWFHSSQPNFCYLFYCSGGRRRWRRLQFCGGRRSAVGGDLVLWSSPGKGRRPRTADDGAAETQAVAATTSVDTLEITATSLAETTAPLEATVTLFNNRVTAEQPWEEPVTAIQVEEASTLIPSGSATSSTATRSHSLQNHMPSSEYADNVALLNPQSHFPLTIHSAVTGTTSAATLEAIATPAADTSATILEATATVRNEAVTQEQLWEDPAMARQVEEASTLVPSHAATSSNAAPVVESSNHLQSAITEEAELVRLWTGEQPIVALPQAGGMGPAVAQRS